jgi:hypothetical protein
LNIHHPCESSKASFLLKLLLLISSHNKKKVEKNHFFDATFSYRLELMRQIYNTAESPQMAIFQLLDMMPSVGTGEASATASTPAAVPKAEFTSGQSSCKNPSKLSLANLMPSRSDNDETNYDLPFHLYYFADSTFLLILKRINVYDIYEEIVRLWIVKL